MASEGVDSGSDEGKFEWPIIGIDLGTTYSCVSVWRNNHPEVILNDINQRLTPSTVAFAGGELLVGEAAKKHITSNPQNTIYDVKRLIGRRFKDEIVQKDMELWSFKVVEGSIGEPRIVVRHENGDEEMDFAVQEISSMILKKLKEAAQEWLGVEVHNAVITVPAYFNDSQRRATKDAGKIAGLNVVRVINEPTAAALAYAQHQEHRCKDKKKVLVFDLGGSTLDVSIVEMEGPQFNVKATSGDTHLGGEDFDNNMVYYLAKEFEKKTKIDILTGENDQKPLRRLRKEWEKMKRSLSYQKSVVIDIDSLSGDKDFTIKVTRAKFEQLNKDLFMKSLEPIDICLKGAGMTEEDIDEVVLVGGSTRIPKIRELLKKHFYGKEPCHTINPDEAVACGAAIQGAILGKVEDPLIRHLKVMDVTPLSLGINDGAGRMSFVLNRCTPTPINLPNTRCTLFDNQTEMTFQVYEGERPMVKDNHHLGDVVLKGISPAPAGKSVVDLIFDIDEDGILTVTVKDKKGGKEASVTMTNDVGRLSEKEIEKMISDAVKWEAHDHLLKKKFYAKNELEARFNDMNNKLSMKGMRDKMGSTLYNRFRVYATELEKWINKEGKDATYEELKEEIMKLKRMQRMSTSSNDDITKMSSPIYSDVEPVIGIDFGTCNSCIAVWDIREAMIIHDDEGKTVIPSYIAFPKEEEEEEDDDDDDDADVEDDRVLVGNAAKSQMANNPSNTIFGLKRLVGRKFDDKRVQRYVELWPFEVVGGEDNEPEIIVEHQKEKKQYKIQEILSMLLRKMKDLAEKKLNKKPIKDAIVTIPVHFGQSECAIIREAATQVEFNIDHFISEPTAAAVAYRDNNYMSDEKANVLVFDLGGGTLDVSLLEMRKSVVEVRAVAGDPSLGGDDFDDRLIEHLIEIFRKKHNVDIRTSCDDSARQKSLGKLKAACEQAKLRLCTPKIVSTKVDIESLYKGMDFSEEVELSSFNEMNKDLFDKCIEPVKQCLDKAKVMAKDVDEVILVGGSSRIQKIRELLQGFFPGKKLLDRIQPEEVVAKGAAVLGAKFSSCKEDDFLKEFNLTNNLTFVSIGIEMNDGSMEVVIERNTQFPAEGVTTLDHNQCPMTLHVYAGDYKTANQNILLGTLTFPSITPTQNEKGDCAWEVTFFMDKNDAVHVKVKDTKSGIHREETFTEKLNLNEIAKMEKRKDKIRQEKKMLQNKKEACNELKECVDSLSDKLKDEKSKMGDHYYDFLNRANSNAKAWLESEGLTAELGFIKKMKKDHKLIFNAFDKDINLQPQEFVASGVAIVEPEVFSTVSIGLRREDGSMKVIIPKDTKLPATKVITLYWNQHPATLSVYEGEKEMTDDNRLLQKLKLPELESIVTGGCIVEVTLTVDRNNGVQVTANYNKIRKAISISDKSGRLSKIEIDKMIEENEKMSLEQKTAQKKWVALNEIKDYVDLLTAKLKNENVREKFGKYKYDNLSLASIKAKAWLDNEGPNAELEDISKMEKYQEWIFKTFL